MDNLNNFHEKAHKAASSVSTMNPAEAMAKSLTSEMPKIDSAIKSYMSLCVARSMSGSDPNKKNDNITTTTSLAQSTLRDTIESPMETGVIKKCYFSKSSNPHQAALLCARSLLKSINSFTVPLLQNDEEEKGQEDKQNEEKMNKNLEYNVVRILWNGLIKNGQKPSLILGQTSLSIVFPLILESCYQIERKDNDDNNFPANVALDEAQIFMKEFGYLLSNAEKRNNGNLQMGKRDDKDTFLNQDDDDSCLIWDLDKGKAELERRRKRREHKSSVMKEKEEKNSDSSLTIEEIE